MLEVILLTCIHTSLVQTLLLPLWSFVFGRRTAEKRQSVFKEIERLQAALKKERVPEIPQVPSRTELIQSIFAEKMQAAGLTFEPSEGDSVAVPYTRFTLFLRDIGMSDEMIDALLTGIGEAENEAEVRLLISAAADTLEISLKSEHIQTAEQLAVEEWRRIRRLGIESEWEQ